MPTTPFVLDVRNLASGYLTPEPRNIFENVGMEIAEGEIVSLIGASGCGKSSLLRTVAGLRPIQEGKVLLHGKSIQEPDVHIGFVFQKPVLFPWLNVRKNIAFGLTLRHVQRLSKVELATRVERALDDVGLRDAERLRPHQLSGGMAQRVALARALAREPSLLLLDEPLGALDAITRLEMQKLILEVAARHHISVLWVTHDIDEALLVSDRILLMDRQPGRIIADWRVASPKPRFEMLDQLIGLRATILAALSKVAGPVRTSTSKNL